MKILMVDDSKFRTDFLFILPLLSALNIIKFNLFHFPFLSRRISLLSYSSFTRCASLIIQKENAHFILFSLSFLLPTPYKLYRVSFFITAPSDLVRNTRLINTDSIKEFFGAVQSAKHSFVRPV